MPYTIPSSVDTQEQAILAVASAVKGEQVTGGDGSVNTALDILADALAGENVEVPMTDQGAILALAQYVGGGGGGDYTTASVTFLNSSQQENFKIGCANVYDGAIVQVVDWEDMDGESTFDVILYKGETYTALPSDVAVQVTAVTGDIEIDHGMAYIHGDGAVTIGDA